VNRTVITTLLLAILASCRILCATSACSHAREEMTAPAGQGDQAPHPVNDDHCLCNGGLQADDCGPLLSGLDPDLVFALPMILPPDPLIGWLAIEPPRALDGWIDPWSARDTASKVRAQLGTYRC
jgi:hypothetical protein